MITVSSDGEVVKVGRVLEYSARYYSFDAIIHEAELMINRTLGIDERLSIQTLLGAFWPRKTLVFHSDGPR